MELGGLLEKLLLEDVMSDALFRGEPVYKFYDPSDSVGPGNTAFTVTVVPTVVSASPRDIASWAVLVIPWNLHRRLARDENDAPPVPFLHGTDIVAAQPDSSFHIHLQVATPILRRDLFKLLLLLEIHAFLAKPPLFF